MPKPLFAIAALLVIAGWLAIFALPSLPEHLNEIGDSFGIVNALFSGLALLAIVYSLALQRDEIRKSSDQIDRQGETINALKEAIKTQSELLEKSVNAQTDQVKQLGNLVEEYRQTREPIARQAELQKQNLQLVQQAQWQARKDQCETAVKDAWELLPATLPETWSERDGLYQSTGFQRAILDMIDFLESADQLGQLKRCLNPSQQKFLREHLFRTDMQVNFSREAEALAFAQALGTIDRADGARLQNYLTARDNYQAKRAVAR